LWRPGNAVTANSIIPVMPLHVKKVTYWCAWKSHVCFDRKKVTFFFIKVKKKKNGTCIVCQHLWPLLLCTSLDYSGLDIYLKRKKWASTMHLTYQRGLMFDLSLKYGIKTSVWEHCFFISWVCTSKGNHKNPEWNRI